MAAEQLRRILLKEMGITSWFPRSPLPGAALSHEQCLQNFLHDEHTLPEAAQTVAPANVSTGMAQLNELLGKTPATSVPASPPSKSLPPTPVHSIPAHSIPAHSTPAHTTPVQSDSAQTARLAAVAPVSVPAVSMPTARDRVRPSEPAQTPGPAGDSSESMQSRSQLSSAAAPAPQVEDFGFSWFNVDKRLAVLTMLPAGNTRLSASCRQMLARMLAALHNPWQNLELVEQSFHWPFADDLGLPVDAVAARQAVDGFIARRLREQNCVMLLVLSDSLPWFFQQSLADADNAADVNQLRVHRQFGFTMLATHSLHAMEKDAGLKRTAWQSMQLLRERLNRNN